MSEILFSYAIQDLTLRHTWTIARGSSDCKTNVFVKLVCEGVTGYGEAAPNIRYEETAASSVDFLKLAQSTVEKADLWHYHNLAEEVAELIPGQTAAKTAIDIAVMDWIGKKVGLPLHRYFGLNKAKTPITTYSIGIDTPEVIKQKIGEAAPFPVLKIKVGLKNDEEVIAAVRSVTDKPLRVDANEGWADKEEALRKIEWLQTQGVELIEQPMPAAMLKETAWLRQRVQIPIIADESVKTTRNIPELAGAFDGINLKLMKAGGIQEAMRMIVLARAFDMKIMLGCMVESSLAISAAASLAPLVDYADLDGNLLISNDPFTGVKVADGQLVLQDAPGVGADPAANIWGKEEG